MGVERLQPKLRSPDGVTDDFPTSWKGSSELTSRAEAVVASGAESAYRSRLRQPTMTTHQCSSPLSSSVSPK
jgi:hypothetical protein